MALCPLGLAQGKPTYSIAVLYVGSFENPKSGDFFLAVPLTQNIDCVSDLTSDLSLLIASCSKISALSRTRLKVTPH